MACFGMSYLIMLKLGFVVIQRLYGTYKSKKLRTLISEFTRIHLRNGEITHFIKVNFRVNILSSKITSIKYTPDAICEEKIGVKEIS